MELLLRQWNAEGETRPSVSLSFYPSLMDKIACAWAIFNNGVRLQKKEGVCVETVSFYCISRGRSKWRTRPQATPNKNNQSKDWLFLFGGDGETRTLAPVSRPTPLAGAPLRPLEYFSRAKCVKNYLIVKWRRGWDSNPRPLRVTGFQDRLLKPLGHLSTVGAPPRGARVR